MKKNQLFLAALAAAILAGCGGSGGMQAGAGTSSIVAPASGTVAGTRIDFSPVQSILFSAIEQKRTVVVKDATEWARLWAEHAGDRAPLPAVDFSRNMVVGIWAGPGTSACGTTAIDTVTRLANPDRIEVGYRITDPGPNVMCIAAYINQHSLAVVPASNLPVEFVLLK